MVVVRGNNLQLLPRWLHLASVDPVKFMCLEQYTRNR